MSKTTVDEFGNTVKTVPCHCIGPLTFGEPIPDCESCHGSGLTKVVQLEPNPRPHPRETQIQTEVRLERERCIRIVRDRARAARESVDRLAQLSYGLGAKAYISWASELEGLAEDMARGPLDR